jgi:flagellar protein FliO/FliZ
MASMSQSLTYVGLFLAVLLCLPFAVKWLKQRNMLGEAVVDAQLKLISSVAVGQTQRVVTVEIGPIGSRMWLTLGVTAQSITCLHSAPVSNRLNRENARDVH